MSFQEILYIWLAVLFVAYVGGWVAHIMDRRAPNLSGVSLHIPLILPQSESDLRTLVFSQREPSTAYWLSALFIGYRRQASERRPEDVGDSHLPRYPGHGDARNIGGGRRAL